MHSDLFQTCARLPEIAHCGVVGYPEDKLFANTILYGWLWYCKYCRCNYYNTTRGYLRRAGTCEITPCAETKNERKKSSEISELSIYQHRDQTFLAITNLSLQRFCVALTDLMVSKFIVAPISGQTKILTWGVHRKTRACYTPIQIR